MDMMESIKTAYVSGYCDAFDGKYQPYESTAPLFVQRAYESGYKDGLANKADLAKS